MADRFIAHFRLELALHKLVFSFRLLKFLVNLHNFLLPEIRFMSGGAYPHASNDHVSEF